MRARVVCLAGLIALTAPAVGRAADLPPDLALVPGSALGFIHVRVAELWKGPELKELRKLLEKADPKYLDLLDRRFVPEPSSIDRCTIILSLDPNRGEPSFLFVLTTTRPFDRDKLLKESLPRAQERKSGNSVYYFDDSLDVAVQVVGERLLIFGPEAALKSYLGRTDTGVGAFAPALESAAHKGPVTLALNSARLPADLLREAPPFVRPLLAGGVAEFNLQTGAAPALNVRLSYAGSDGAGAAEAALKETLVAGRKFLADYRKEAESKLFGPSAARRTSLEELPEAAAAVAALGLVAQLEEILQGFSFKREGNALATSLPIPPGHLANIAATAGVAAGLLLPGVQRVRMAAARIKSANNLKQISLAIINYSDAFNGLPPAAICDKKGKPLLSWRVAILPFIEQEALYRQFHLDEPWDSEHNIKLAHVVVPTYVFPRDEGKVERHLTRYLALVGNGAGFELKGGLKFPASFPDGTSNTLWVVEADKAVPWSKPEDIEYDPKKMPGVGFHWPGRICNAAFADGSVRALSSRVPERTWHLLIQRADGQVIPNDFDK